MKFFLLVLPEIQTFLLLNEEIGSDLVLYDSDIVLHIFVQLYFEYSHPKQVLCHNILYSYDPCLNLFIK